MWQQDEEIPVLRDFRYRGACLHATSMRQAATVDRRIHKTTPMLRRLQHVLVKVEAKAKAKRTGVCPAAFYGIEVTKITAA